MYGGGGATREDLPAADRECIRAARKVGPGPFTATRVTRGNLHVRQKAEFSKDICLVWLCFVSLIFIRV